ncbi:MAG: UDP-N-acetylmuramoyl-L-alanyl-D-glutamate--2,6-diaminopimelate ligase [Nitrospinae bacterium]|nr:UDP-N-acetylmuramoyl-L-alanyl-D-glutamate--2,6-diaminopimelate ligase [Nitrospinota bacterium]
MTGAKSLEEALKTIAPLRVAGHGAGALNGLCYDSRQTSSGFAFVAIPGAKLDGTAFVADALDRGASMIVAEKEPQTPIPANVTMVVVENARKALGALAGYFYNWPASALSVVGITGTNGKTTTSYLIAGMMRTAGRSCGRIGTVGHDLLTGTEMPAENTTPEALDLMRMLATIRKHGGSACAMEVSSHALDQGRADAVKFSTAVFTNLTQDHLDYHGDMERYFAAKARLFTELSPGHAVINMDDPYGVRLFDITHAPKITYGLQPGADCFAEGVAVTVEGISMTLKTPFGDAPLRSPLVGRHNVYNILATAAVAVAEGVDIDTLVKGVASLKNVPGRFESVNAGQPFALIVDYAHTDDALVNVLTTARGVTRGKLITVFGCGGDRDRKKRPLMGRAAWRLSDRVVVTSDNPRTEDPDKIIEEVLAGIDREENPAGELMVEADRRAAIRSAVAQAREGDIVVIAGKGHENYQIIGATKIHFDDREEAAEAVRLLNASV